MLLSNLVYVMPYDADHKPYISAKEILPEITIQGIILAILLGFLLTAANDSPDETAV